MIAAILVLAATVAAEPRITTYPVPGGRIPTELVRQGDALRFVAWRDWPKISATIGRVDASGKFALHDVPEGQMPGLTARASDGTLWLSDGRAPQFWRVAAGRIEQVPAPRATQGIAFGPDGNLWCTHRGSSIIGKYGTDGTEKATFDVKGQPLYIVAGADGALWFTDAASRGIGRLTTSGDVKLFPLPPTFGKPGQLVAGRDSVWFAVSGPVLGRVAPDGTITTVKVGINATWLATDSKGRTWYTDGVRAGYVGRDGTTRELEVEGAKNIRALAEGPDGAMWFADQGAATIGRIELP